MRGDGMRWDEMRWLLLAAWLYSSVYEYGCPLKPREQITGMHIEWPRYWYYAVKDGNCPRAPGGICAQYRVGSMTCPNWANPVRSPFGGQAFPRQHLGRSCVEDVENEQKQSWALPSVKTASFSAAGRRSLSHFTRRRGADPSSAAYLLTISDREFYGQPNAIVDAKPTETRWPAKPTARLPETHMTTRRDCPTPSVRRMRFPRSARHHLNPYHD
jgi:hypothetical protein